MRRWGLAVVLLALLSAASASAQTLTVHDSVGLNKRTLASIEFAVTRQANIQLRRWWHTPRITFGAGGWPVYIVTSRYLRTLIPGGDFGFHDVDNGKPVVYVEWDGSYDALSYYLSHETLEALVNPTAVSVLSGWAREVCDPVAANSYLVHDWAVSDFVTPHWFAGGRGPVDQMGVAGRAPDVTAGFATRVSEDGTETVVAGPGG